MQIGFSLRREWEVNIKSFLPFWLKTFQWTTFSRLVLSCQHHAFESYHFHLWTKPITTKTVVTILYSKSYTILKINTIRSQEFYYHVTIHFIDMCYILEYHYLALSFSFSLWLSLPITWYSSSKLCLNEDILRRHDRLQKEIDFLYPLYVCIDSFFNRL